MATAFLGIIACATFVPLNPRYKLEEYDSLLPDLRVKALIVKAGSDSAALEVAAFRNIPVIELSPLLQAEAGRFTLESSHHILSYATKKGFAGPDDTAIGPSHVRNDIPI